MGNFCQNVVNVPRLPEVFADGVMNFYALRSYYLIRVVFEEYAPVDDI